MKKRLLYINAIAFFFALSGAGSLKAQNKIIPNIYKQTDNSVMTQWVDSVYNKMSPDQRIGQLFVMIAATDNTAANKNAIVNTVKNQHIGGILFSKGTPLDQASLTNAAQSESKIPLLITLDGEWGLSMRLSNTTVFPYNMMLGAIRNDSLLYYYGLEVARQCRLMGIHVNFAPDMDVNSNPDNPVIGYRAYGEDPKRVAQLGIMYAKGLEAGGVMAVSKHFPGHGDTSTDSHKTLPLITHSRNRFDNVELYPFKKYIEAGLSGIMVGHLDIPALEPKRIPSSLSQKITTDLLQNEMGFSGLIFTDGLQMKGVTIVDNHCVDALLAGNDVLLGPISVPKEFEKVKKAVKSGVLSDSLIEAKCKKILAYKYILGVNKTAPIDTKGLVRKLNEPSSIATNRRLNAAAMTLLKDHDKLIPIKELEDKKIAAVSVGATSGNVFQQTLKFYGDVDCFSVTDSNSMARMIKTLADYNTVIISVHGRKAPQMDEGIRALCKNKESVFVYFDNPYRMKNYNLAIKNADAFLLAYENSDLAQEYAAQALFGGIDIDGVIPVSVKGLFDEGDGMEKKKVRLSYDVPENIGIHSEKLDSIAVIVQEGIEKKAYPGCQILIAKDGVVIYNKAFGTYEYNKPDSITISSVYDIASMTKASATLPAVMKLYDKKEFSLNDPISKFVPAFKGNDKSKITIREALLHESRLPSFIPYYMNAIDTDSYEGKLFSSRRDAQHPVQFDGNTWARTDYKFKSNTISQFGKEGYAPLAENMYINRAYRDTIIESIANSKLLPRKRYMYSCLNFIMLQQVVETVSKKDLNSYVQQNFFRPLGSISTTYNPLTKMERKIIVPTENDKFLRKQLLRGYVHDEGAAFMGGISGNAGLFSNANDLAKLYQMFLNKGTYGGKRYLSEKTINYFTQTGSSISRRGLGFDKPDVGGKYSPTSYSAPASTYGHTGFTGTCFWVDPDNDLIYIFLSNRVNESRTSNELSALKIRERIQEEIYNALR